MEYIIKQGIRQVETPYYTFDSEFFKRNIGKFDAALKDFFSDHEIAYSVKTNSLPYIIKIAYECGCLLEVTSYDEYDLVKTIGVPVNKIVYNGPCKDRKTFIEAVNGGACVNIECDREIDWLEECNEGSSVGIRVNVDLDKISPEDAKSEENGSRFGISYEDGDLLRQIEKIEKQGAILSGIHVHKTSRTRSANVYWNVAKYLSGILDELGRNIDYIDIGGGFCGGIDSDDLPSYEDYAAAIRNGLDKWSNKKIIVEPGSAAVAASIKYYMKVIDKKTVGDKAICTVDGSRIDIDPFFHKSSYKYEIDRKKGSRELTSKQYIAGFTCLESDIIFCVEDEDEILPGDMIEIDRVGAYTMSNTPNFIRMTPAVYLAGGGSEEIRQKWTAHEFVQKCKF